MKPHPFIAFLLCVTTSARADAVDFNKFDLDQNGLDAKERRAINLHVTSPFYRMVDTNRNGEIEESEIARQKEDAEAQAPVNENALAEDVKKKGLPAWTDKPVPVTEFASIAPVDWSRADSGEYYPFYGLQLRRNLTDVDLNRWGKKNDKQKYIESLKTVKAAEFGFTHNGITDDEAWFARGVLARPFRLHEDSTSLLLVPSIQFDRVSHSVNASKEVDSLIGDLTLASRLTGGTIIETHEIRGGAQYATNFDFDGSVYGGKLEWEPTFTPVVFPFKILSNGQYSGVLSNKSPLLYRTRQFVHVEGGGTEGKAGKVVDGDYLRAGMGAGIDLTFRGGLGLLERLTLIAEYQYYFDLLGGDRNDDFDSLKTQAQWRLDDTGHLLLQAAYEHGLIPLSHQKVDLVSLSLGIKF